jgi:two-component system sensor histidine kinase BaeS
MRSLTLKFTLAFLFVSIVGVLLTAVIVRQRTKQEFDQFVLDRYQIDLLEDLSGYYRENGGWEEIGAIVVRTRFGRRAGAFPAPLTLTDAAGLVIYGGLNHKAGTSLTDGELERAAPVEVDDETVGWVLFAEFAGQAFSEAESPETRFLENVNQAVLLGALVAIGVALVIGLFLARTISRPVREVTAATQVVAGGEMGYQVPVRTKDELGELAASFNRMSADLAQANQQRRQMTADIAHDLRTPLSVILGYMEALSTGRLEATPETFDIMYDRGRHLQHLIDDLRTLALADAGELSLNRRPVEVRALLEHTALAHMVQAQEKGVALRLEQSAVDLPAVDLPAADQPAADLPQIEVDPERMSQVLGNLISNSLRYTPEGGEIVLSAGHNEGMVQLSVRDTGAGIAAEDLPHIFDRFYRSDRSRQQSGESGLGLAIARSIVRAHGGDITAASVPGEGTTFTIMLPVS